MIFAVLGYEPLDREQLLRYVRDHAAMSATPEIIQWADAYTELAPIAGVRTSIAWVQACHETGFFTYHGDAKPEWNNPCGLGVGAAPLVRLGVEVPNSANCRFQTKAEGVRAHLGHLAVYFAPYEVSGFCEWDPRHIVPHKRLPNDVREIGGVGRWAPNTAYGPDRAREAFELLVAV